MIEAIKNYLKTCPFLKSGKIHVNYLGADAVRYSIEPVPVNPIIKRYTDGGTQRQYTFVFASREYYDAAVLTGMDTAKFYEDFADWLEQQDAAGNLPVLDAGKKAQSVQALTLGYAYDTTTDKARFQIQCRLVFQQERIG